MRLTSKIYALGFVLLLVIGGEDAGWSSASESLPTAEALRVDKSERKLYLLRDGKPYKTYGISLGSHPVGDKVHFTRESEYRRPRALRA